jgi:mono/diheme cytochrome c family protein
MVCGFFLASLGLPGLSVAQTGGDGAPAPEALDELTGEELYLSACANCHGAEGTGEDPALVAFEEALPDFTECGFASREPDGDWVAVAHDGGPARGFSPMMPAFGASLSVEQIERVMGYVRTLCEDDAWPRGELNLPRAILTEKAYPEDESVFETDVALEGPGSLGSAFVYEKRFGARSQIEVVVPYSFRERTLEDRSDERWIGGLGDVVVGVKRDIFHDLSAGSIVSLAAEVKLPTGDESEGFGSGSTVYEAFLSYGQLLPADAFVQLQVVAEVPGDSDLEKEAVWRAAFGRSFTQGAWGRTWSPMVELQGKREMESGATIHWDVVPQMQVTLNTRQHVMANVGVLVPLDDSARPTRLVAYLLLDWFDGGFF